MHYEFTDDYLTGIEFIDQEHKKLFDIANEAYDLLTNNFINDKYDRILNLVVELREYTIIHFADEEKYMESIQYLHRFSHKIEHMKFVEKLNSINLEKIDANQKDSIIDLLGFLVEWLQNHIKKKDCRLRK
ncbi:bacteriohemerythrin [Pectinatus cerevisiiphilus]|uniref:Hemerythrin n=1 Tax=Pectinatus cerevisiiphilus TaxID=86956 RepID=A0A4R3KBI7_9FIRM|nr:hemerythrin family protein [Pectinatus cerevisiiphilus]TCS80544.1 hemerythrin [Pectinatus cerevisiiphilus]